MKKLCKQPTAFNGSFKSYKMKPEEQGEHIKLPDFVVTIAPADLATLVGDAGVEVTPGKWRFSSDTRAIGFDRNPDFGSDRDQEIINFEIASVDPDVEMDAYGVCSMVLAPVEWKPPPDTAEARKLRCLEGQIRAHQRNRYLHSAGLYHLCRDPSRYYNVAMYPKSYSPSGHNTRACEGAGSLFTLRWE